MDDFKRVEENMERQCGIPKKWLNKRPETMAETAAKFSINLPDWVKKMTEGLKLTVSAFAKACANTSYLKIAMESMEAVKWINYSAKWQKRIMRYQCGSHNHRKCMVRIKRASRNLKVCMKKI